MSQKNHPAKEVKCIIWDLDDTIWEGTLSESGRVLLKQNIKEIIIELDSRGILHSIASKNNYDDAISQLKQFELDQFFIYPQINWGAKSNSINKIQEKLNLGIDTFLFVDDQSFEREEVATSHPYIETLNSVDYLTLLDNKRLNPVYITQDSKRRRLMYLEDSQRNREEEDFKGPKSEFLSSLEMKLMITDACDEDLKRAEELTIRTNQLNSTGKTYGFEELSLFMQSQHHKLLICELSDKYGSYGKIGLALSTINETSWHLNLMLISCRVISRGVGSILLTHIMQAAKKEKKTLLADFKQTDKNRMMYVTYKLSNFKEVDNDNNGNIVFQNDLSKIQSFPTYVDVQLV